MFNFFKDRKKFLGSKLWSVSKRVLVNCTFLQEDQNNYLF